MILYLIGAQPHSMANMLYRRDHLAINLHKLGRFADVKYVYFQNGPFFKIGRVKSQRRSNGIEYIQINDNRFLLANYLSIFAVICMLVSGIRVKRTDCVLFTLPRFLAFRKLFSSGHVFYDRSDNWPGQYDRSTITGRIKRRFMNWREKQLFRCSGSITTSSIVMAEMLKEKSGLHLDYLPHGYTPDNANVPINLFSDQAPEFMHASLVASLTSKDQIKVDFDLILEILHASECLFLHICGPLEVTPGPTIQTIINHPRVKYYGVLETKDVKEFVEKSDFGLIPYKINDFTLGVLPIKLLDYVSANRPVCITKLPSVVRDPQFVPLCYFIEDVKRIEAELETFLTHPRTLAALNKCRDSLTWTEIAMRLQNLIFESLAKRD